MDIIYTEFFNAFDEIDHNILAGKLHNLGFCNPFYSCLVYFLTGTKQYVKIKNYITSYYNVSSRDMLSPFSTFI